MKSDLKIALGLNIFSILMLISSTQIKKLPGSPIGADFFPKIVLTLLFFSSGFLFFVKQREIKEKKDLEKTQSSSKSKKDFFMICLFLLYVFCIEKFGFIFSTIFYLTFQLTYFSNKTFKEYLKSFSIAVVFSIFIHYVFVNFLGLMLPGGSISWL